MGGEQLIVRTDESQAAPAIGATIHVTPRADRLHWFDAASGKRSTRSAPCVTAASWPYPRWIAHRGAGKLAPENTLAAFRLGAQPRLPHVRVRREAVSADGVPFLMHDATLERTTNSASSWMPRPATSAASTLERAGAARRRQLAFARLCGRAAAQLGEHRALLPANGYFLNIEIKPTPGVEAPTGEVVAHAAARLWRDAAMPPLLTSFQPDALRGAQAAAAAAAARPAAGHALAGLAGDRASTWTAWPSSATTRCGTRHRRAGPQRRTARLELHRQRRMGGPAPAGPRHRRHHHRPRRFVRAGRAEQPAQAASRAPAATGCWRSPPPAPHRSPSCRRARSTTARASNSGRAHYKINSYLRPPGKGYRAFSCK